MRCSQAAARRPVLPLERKSTSTRWTTRSQANSAIKATTRSGRLWRLVSVRCIWSRITAVARARTYPRASWGPISKINLRTRLQTSFSLLLATSMASRAALRMWNRCRMASSNFIAGSLSISQQRTKVRISFLHRAIRRVNFTRSPMGTEQGENSCDGNVGQSEKFAYFRLSHSGCSDSPT